MSRHAVALARLHLADAFAVLRGVACEGVRTGRWPARSANVDRVVGKTLCPAFPPEWDPGSWVDVGRGLRVRRLDPEELVAEGEGMQHCVASLGPRVRDGSVRVHAVWFGEERLTVSILHDAEGRAALGELRGPHNHSASLEAAAAVRAWIRVAMPSDDRVGREVERSAGASRPRSDARTPETSRLSETAPPARLSDMTALAPTPHLADILPPDLRLGEHCAVGALTLFPILGASNDTSFVLLADALSRGGRLGELPEAEVNRLLLDAPPGVRVLLFAGEEVVGAKQNRIVNATLAVAPGTTVTIPVSCIEQRRWSPGAERDPFSTSTQVAYTSLRRAVTRMTSESRARDGTWTTDQRGVWRDVSDQHTRTGVHSRTGAMTDLYAARRAELEAVTEGSAPEPDQLGLIAFVGDDLASLDLVCRADAWRSLHARVVRGHALEALERTTRASATSEHARDVLEGLRSAPFTLAPAAVGLGYELRVSDRIAVGGAGRALEGAGLVLDGVIVQLSVFQAAA